VRGAITPEMKINIKWSPNKSSQLVNGKAHFFTRDCESEVIMALEWNTIKLSKATKAGLKEQ
jgi:hypothetical protein